MTRAVVLLCDRDYLVPTVGAALMARAQLSDPGVRILLYLTQPDHAAAEAARRALGPRGVELRVARLEGLDAMPTNGLDNSHLTAATMGRFWLDELLPPEVTRFLYLDGDIDVTGPLDPLLALPVPQHGFLAAPDVNLLIEGELGGRGRAARDYLAGLGLARGARYFNAGVLLVERAGWGRISAEARAFLRAHPERCPFQDQCALNAVAGEARGELSPVWNWQTDFMAVADPLRLGVRPAIWHFTGFPKPWQASFPPWGEGFGRGFALGAGVLAPFGIAPPPQDEDAVAAAARYWRDAQRRLDRVYPWRKLTRRRRLRAAIARCAAAPPAAAAAPQQEMRLAEH